MASEIIRDMKRRETEAIGELSGILMDLDKVLYTLEVVQENSDIVGKSVNDGALFMMNRNRIYQNSSIAHDYVRGFELIQLTERKSRCLHTLVQRQSELMRIVNIWNRQLRLPFIWVEVMHREHTTR